MNLFSFLFQSVAAYWPMIMVLLHLRGTLETTRQEEIVSGTF